MATTKKTTTKKTVKSITVNVQLPGHAPEKRKYAAGTTVEQVVEDINLTGYQISVNGSSASESDVLENNDTLRAGLKTKNAF